MQFSGFIFDLDGTLLYTLEDIAQAENKALAELGLPPRPVEEYRWIVGGGAEDIAKRLLPKEMHNEQDILAFVLRFRGHYHANWHDKTCLYDGISTLLKSITDKGLHLAVLSNKPEEFVGKIVDFYFPGWQGNPSPPLFTHVYGQIKGKPTKPDPSLALEISRDWGAEPSSIGFVGDSDIDIFTAQNAGMVGIGAGWGFRGKQELIDSGAQILLDYPADLLRYL